MNKGDRPFRVLGWHLKLAREQLTESMDEVSGAVEIDTKDLEHIEHGKTRPSEDVLMLLISHLGLEDAEATSLWEMAGYTSDKEFSADDKNNSSDLRILYTDLVHMAVNDSGVVMNFLQASGTSNQPLSVARVGMSKTQASHMLKILQQSLKQTNTLKTKNLSAKNRLLNEGENPNKK